MKNPTKIILAITGASGAIYAKYFIKRISDKQEEVSECTVIFSKNGKDVWKYELDEIFNPENNKNIRVVDNSNMFDAVSSGSAGYNSMIILPCSMGTLGRISSGCSDTLISRAADVMLKEKRKLILVTREAPYNYIHLKNMLTVVRAGGIIFPASPFFYHKPQNIEQLIAPFIERILEKADLEHQSYKWGITNED